MVLEKMYLANIRGKFTRMSSEKYITHQDVGECPIHEFEVTLRTLQKDFAFLQGAGPI